MHYVDILAERGQLVPAARVKADILNDAEGRANKAVLPWPWCELSAQAVAKMLPQHTLDAAIDGMARRRGLVAVDEDNFARPEDAASARAALCARTMDAERGR